MVTGPHDSFPNPRATDEAIRKPNNGWRRLMYVNVFPDEYIAWRDYCRKRRVPMSTMARHVLLAYLKKMEARGDE